MYAKSALCVISFALSFAASAANHAEFAGLSENSKGSHSGAKHKRVELKQTPTGVRPLSSSGPGYGELIFEKQATNVAANSVSGLLYVSPSYYQSGYIYTAVLTSTSGDADLHLYKKLTTGSYQKLKFSDLTPSSQGGQDIFEFTTNDSFSGSTSIELDAVGYSNAIYTFKLYRKQAVSATAQNIVMGYPLNGTSMNVGGYHQGDFWLSKYCTDKSGQWDYRLRHIGSDLVANAGDPVYAAAGGTVKYAATDPKWGGYVVLDHSTYTTTYTHVTLDPRWTVGSYIPVWYQIAATSSGDGSFGPHLHFAVRTKPYTTPDIPLRGRLPQTACDGDPAYAESFVDPETITGMYY